MDNKQAYIEKLEGRLQTWKGKTDQIKGEAKETGADTKLKLNDKIDNLQDQISNMENSLEEMKDPGTTKGEEMTERADRMWNDFSDRFDAVRTSVMKESNTM